MAVNERDFLIKILDESDPEGGTFIQEKIMTDAEKILKWLDYAIEVNRTEWIKSREEYWSGRMVAYRNMKQRILENDFEVED